MIMLIKVKVPMIHFQQVNLFINQSECFCFVLAMHIATVLELKRGLYPALKHLHDELKKNQKSFH
jgi:fumarate hydratase class II